MAHARLYAELRSIALDLLGPCEPGELPGAMASWVEHAATLATSAVCDESLQALIRVLDATVAGAPPDVLRRLEDAAARHGVGFD